MAKKMGTGLLIRGRRHRAVTGTPPGSPGIWVKTFQL